MKMKTIFALLLVCLVSATFGADTLEVFAIRVQFAEEQNDNSLTTGNGLFDSDTKHKDAYKLDPPGRRNSIPYWKKHFDFANAYYQSASNGNLVIKSRIFPETSSAYKLKKQIIDYNRTSRLKGEKTAEFDDARSRDYLQFVYDAVMAADTTPNVGESPFRIPLSENSNTKRAYMIIHAGASRLVDGGSMGTRNADTPGDFMDVYISRDAWEYLPDTLDGVAVSEDSVVNGMVLKGAAIDTLRTIMVMSETASQDGLNWGVNGILVNQIGRELGMPNTYDVVKGISRLGYFDMLDFAGYNAGNGFLPSMPAAWNRAYMGWTQVKEVRPVAGKTISVDIAAAGSGLGTEIVKVPLSASEYLLIENRQRSWNEDGLVSVVLGDPDESSDTIIKTVPVDSLNLVFEDSVCVKGKCSGNKKKASGIILDVSSFDAGIPASGIAIWKVNDWYLRETLEYGIANFWAGDTLRDHQFGLSLIEADGVLSIGKTFKNALGEDSYDYGSGTDLLPHLRVAENGSAKKDTVRSIGPSGYANTMTTQGGYTGIKISVSIPEKYRVEKSSNGFMGDSVLNFAAPVITVSISLDDGGIEGAEFPRNIGVASAVRGAVFIDDPEKDGEKIFVVGGVDGSLQAFSALGDTLFMADTVVTEKLVARNDAEKEVPLYRLGSSKGNLLGIASDEGYIISLHETTLARTRIGSGMIVQDDELSVKDPMAGPVVFDGKIWVATKTALRSAFVNKDGAFEWAADSLALETVLAKAPFDGFVPNDMAICKDGSVYRVAVAGEEGKWVSYPIGLSVGGDGEVLFAQGDAISGESFRIACADMDRNEKEDMVFVGSRGSVFALDVAGKNLWKTKTYKRGLTGSSLLKDETSGIAVGDINDDGYPEAVFLGYNLVYALDRFGLPVAGYPVELTRSSPVYGFFSDPLIVDVTGDDVPEILVPSSDGLVYAVSGKGKKISEGFPLATGSFEYVDSVQAMQPMSIFVANAVADSKSSGPELYALHRNFASAVRLPKASADAAKSKLAWTLPAAGNGRTGRFDASQLKSLDAGSEKSEITEFFMFPNPVRGGNAKARFEIGAEASSATLELYDITGLCVFKAKLDDVVRGRNQFEDLDLTKLGSDVYTARLKVKFKNGKTKQKLYRVGMVR